MEMETEFRVGDRVEWTDGGGTTHHGVVVDTERGKVWWTCPTLGKSWLQPHRLTLVSRAETPEPEWLVEARKQLPPGWTVRLEPSLHVTGGAYAYLYAPDGRSPMRERGSGCTPADGPYWVRDLARRTAELLGLPDPYAKPEPPRAFQVGDRVRMELVTGTKYATVSRPDDGDRNVWFVVDGRSPDDETYLQRTGLTLITPAAPVTVQDGVAVLPEQ